MSKNYDKDNLGTRMKSYEEPSTSRKAYNGQIMIVRLDGNNFHNFTKGLKRPYDARLSTLMVIVTEALVEKFRAKIGYTQSDEITLVFTSGDSGNGVFEYDGRLQKYESLTAAYATVIFNKHLATGIPEKADTTPIFDARAYVVPNLREAYHVLLWRQQDATKNAISMAAQSMFSHKSLQGMTGPEMQERMFSEKGVNFNDYPYFFKRGTFVRRVSRIKDMTPEDLARIPEKYRPAGPVRRTVIESMDIWLSKTAEPLNVLFGDQRDPTISALWQIARYMDREASDIAIDALVSAGELNKNFETLEQPPEKKLTRRQNNYAITAKYMGQKIVVYKIDDNFEAHIPELKIISKGPWKNQGTAIRAAKVEIDGYLNKLQKAGEFERTDDIPF